MTYYETRTRTHTTTYTYIDVRHVNWKIRSDLRYIRFLYGLFTERYEEDMSRDIYQWVLAGYASQIRFVFYTRFGLELKFGLRYRISSTGEVSRDDDAGDIPYVSLPVDTRFDVLVTPSARWALLSADQKADFYRRLLTPGWGSSNLHLVERGTWSPDHIYSSNRLSAQRDIFKSL